MKKRRKLKMKRKLALVCSTVLLAGSFTALAGCDLSKKNEDEKTVMNLSLNPKVEFILDTDDKVISVNALNEEGNLVVSAEAFTGKTAEEAAKLFVEVSADTGFLIEGSAYAADNKISVSFSGDTEEAKKLYDTVQSQISTYLSSIDISATIEQAAAITEAQLKALVEECAPYVETAKMQYAELVEELEKSRKETAELFSQELKKAYYDAKAFAMEQAKMEVVKEQLNVVEKLAFETAYALYTSSVATIEDIRKTFLVNEDSIYQLALKDFREKKAEFLNYKNYIASLPEGEVSEAQTARLAQISAALETAETALVGAGETANKQLDSAKALATTHYEAVKALITDLSDKVKANADAISAKQTEAQTAFFTAFESNHAAAKTAAENNWKAMQLLLKAGTVNE